MVQISNKSNSLSLEWKQGFWATQFNAMASPCQILIDSDDQTQSKSHALHLAKIAQQEALRIEKKFSRYRTDNLIYQINHSKGRAVHIDEELAGLLDYATSCYNISDGLFDITSGILRQLWKFDCSDNIPTQAEISPLLNNIGWNKVVWKKPYLTLPEGMEIDLGGIGKEYAVDRSAQILNSVTTHSFLINYGGDLFVNKPRKNNQGWMVGVENPEHPLSDNRLASVTREPDKLYELSQGGMATSGDSRRFLLKEGIRYSHILNPKTGWSITQAPHSITVIANTCTEAGILSTLAMLQEKHAAEFLEEQNVIYWCR